MGGKEGIKSDNFKTGMEAKGNKPMKSKQAVLYSNSFSVGKNAVAHQCGSVLNVSL